MRLNKLEKTAVDALEDIKARDIVIFDVRKLTSLYDTMILATAESARQTKALASNVQEKAKAAGGKVVGVEGEQSGEWVLVDLGDIVVHIMQPAIRQYYNLEELWSHAPRSGSSTKRRTPATRTSGGEGSAVEPATAGHATGGRAKAERSPIERPPTKRPPSGRTSSRRRSVAATPRRRTKPTAAS